MGLMLIQEIDVVESTLVRAAREHSHAFACPAQCLSCANPVLRIAMAGLTWATNFKAPPPDCPFHSNRNGPTHPVGQVWQRLE